MADSSSTTNLTREQQEFLDECLTEFANRFTEDDEDYKKAYDRDITTPPIVSPWYGRPRLTAARSNYRQGRYNRDRYENREPRYDRQRDREDGYSNQRYRPY